MSKTKNPPPSTPGPPTNAVGRLEEAVIRSTGKASKLLQEYQTPLLAAAVVIVAGIGVWGLLRAYEGKKERDWNTRLYALLEQTDDEFRAGYPELLSSLEGTRIEPFAANSIANRLQESHPDEALQVLRATLARYEDDPLLALHVKRLETASTENQSFEVPEPPPPPEPAPRSPEFPGPLTADKLEALAPDPESSPSPPGDDGN